MDSAALNTNWKAVCEQVKSYDKADVSQINAIFSRVHPQAMSENFLMLSADNSFIKSWVDRHYLSYIKQALTDLYSVPFTVTVEVDETADQNNIQDLNEQKNTNDLSANPTRLSQEESSATSSFDTTAHTNTVAVSDDEIKNKNKQGEQPRENYISNIVSSSQAFFIDKEPEKIKTENITSDANTSPTFTFENFVIGDSNRMAYSMAVNVAEMPGKTPLNPLFIYGKSGLGKTHLMRAIQNYVCETQPYLKTVYVDSAELLSDYMDASAAHDKEKSSYKNFKKHYEDADILLIDDIQYLQGKKQTLDIVFQIFNKLSDQGRQIVLSADRAPKNIDIDERYHSRFNQGGTIDIQPPEIETKLGIVKAFIEEYKKNEDLEQFSVSEDIQAYIAENSSSNIRELKSAVTKVIYQITFLKNTDLTVDDVRVLLENHFSGGNSKNLTVEDIQKTVEDFYKVKHSDLIGTKRARTITYPRHLAIYLCRQLLDVPFNDIGKKFNRDHSTAMHSVTKVEEMMRQNREVQEEISTIEQIIREL